MNRTYAIHTDPGDAWVQVPRQDIVDLGIEMDRSGDMLNLGSSGASRMTPDFAFLDEEAEFLVFERKARKAGWSVGLGEFNNAPVRSPIRDLLPLNSDVLRRGFVGSRVELQGGSGRVVGIDRTPGQSALVLRVTEAAPGSGLDASRLGGIYAVPTARAANYINAISPAPAQTLTDDLREAASLRR